MRVAQTSYDVVVVGGRIAGAATAMLLAHEGMNVLVVERSSFGSDTLSTHALLAPAVTLLDHWGLLDGIVQLGTPPVESTAFFYESRPPVSFDLSSRPLYAPRRTVVDPVLAEAAGAAGATVLFGTPVVDLLTSGDGAVRGVVIDATAGPVEVRAPLVIGADGMRSFVARRVAAPITHVSRHSSGVVMACFAGIEDRGYRWYFGREASAGAIPTNDGLTHVFASVSTDRFRREGRSDVGQMFETGLREAAPDLLAELESAKQATRYRSSPGARGFAKRPFGPGWALAGDSGAYTDPMTAHGMSAALRDALYCADAAVTALGRPSGAAEIWASYERARNEIVVPHLGLIDEVTAYRHDMTRVQRAHVAMSKLTNHELTHIKRRIGSSVAA